MAKDYKDTLNLPVTAFPMKANLTQREPEFLKFWQENTVYQKIQSRNAHGEAYILHDGPPYANGHIHIGHALNKILKDIIVKYRTMKGFYSPYVPGWDCHGLPIELQVDKKLGEKKYEIDILEKRKLCREYAEKFMDIQREEFVRLGVLGDWSNPYLTMTHDYEASIIKEFYRFLEKGYIYRGRKPVHWCASCITALAEAEVEYNEKISPSIYVKFRVHHEDADRIAPNRNGDIFIIIWTTTPWTLPANLALAVHPDIEYALLKGKENYMIANPLVKSLKEALDLEGSIIKKFEGKELQGIKTHHPFIDRESIIVTGDFVTVEEGTGIVHIAPGHGEDDFEIGIKYGLDIYAPVDDRGMFMENTGNLQGKFVFKANEEIIDILEQNNALLNRSDITHSYPHCWRCKKPVLFRATEQWFISVEKDSLRDKCLEQIDKVEWIPSWGKERITGMVKNRPDWCISRQRSWGVPIAVFVCDKCGEIVLDRPILDTIVRQFEENSADVWFKLDISDILPPDFECRKCSCKAFNKELDILDVWFDSGVSHAAVVEKDKRLNWPAHMYLEGSDQHRGWFQSSLIASTGTRGIAPFRTVLTHGFVVDGEGKKMSKSVGNVIAPQDIIKRNGAEILRLWVSAEDYRDDIRISDEIIQRLTEAYRKIRNTCRFLLGNISNFDDNDYSQALLEIDRWALARLQNLIEKVTTAYEKFDFHEVFHRLYNFCIVDMSSFYLDILKDRLYTFRANSTERRAAQWTMKQILSSLTRLMAPILSFTAEEVWKFMNENEEESVFLTDFPVPNKEFSNDDVEKRWAALITIRNTVNKALELKRQEKFIGNSLEARIILYCQNDQAYSILENYLHFLPTLFIVSQTELVQGDIPEEKEQYVFESEDFQGLFVLVEKAEGEKCERCWNFSTKVGAFQDFPEVCEKCLKVLVD